MSRAYPALAPCQRLRVARCAAHHRKWLAGFQGCGTVQLLLADGQTLGDGLRRQG
jgi:hypothetical protein